MMCLSRNTNFFVLLLTPCLAVAVQLCIELIAIKKIFFPLKMGSYSLFYVIRLLGVWVHLTISLVCVTSTMMKKIFGSHMIAHAYKIAHVNCCTCTYFFPKQTAVGPYCRSLKKNISLLIAVTKLNLESDEQKKQLLLLLLLLTLFNIKIKILAIIQKLLINID